jgi:hypothetical protein
LGRDAQTSLHESPELSAEVHRPDHAQAEDPSAGVRVTVIVQNRITFDTHRVTGRQIKQAATVPARFALYRRTRGGNEPIADGQEVVLLRGDHFFARPSREA